MRCFVVSLWASVQLGACFARVVKSDFVKKGTFLFSRIALGFMQGHKKPLCCLFFKEEKKVSAFACRCVAWQGMGAVRKERRSWRGTAFINGDDVEMQSFQNWELPAG